MTSIQKRQNYLDNAHSPPPYISHMTLSFRQAKQYWLAIFGIGLALGIANYSLGVWPNLGQSIVLQIIISVVIGYLSLLACFNVRDRFH